MKHTLELEFPLLTDNIIKELKSIHNTAENPNCIERQIEAFEQLKLNTVPAPGSNWKFQKPTIFKIPDSKRWQPMTIAELRSKIHGDIVIGPKAALDEQLVETLENEIQDLKTLNPTSTLTPCLLCCRTFISPTDAIEHTLTIHPRFNLNEVETPKFSSKLKSQVNVRETTFTKLLLNQLSWQQKLAIANEIVDRKNENPQKLKVEKEMCKKPNYYVSQY